MSDASENWVYIAESDPDAWAKASRPIQILVFTILTAFVTMGCLAWWADPPQGEKPWLPLLAAIWVIGVLAARFLSSRVQGPAMMRSVWFGVDFVASSARGMNTGVTIAKYQDIARVTLHLSKGRITGATIRAGWMTSIVAKWIKDPAIVVRAIFEHAPERVKWQRSGWQLSTRLSREQVAALIEEAHPPDIDHLLPPGITWARAKDMFPWKKASGKNVFARLFARGPARHAEAVSLRTLTPTGRYVGFILLQMFETGPKRRVLKRSDPLPALSMGTETAEPPSFEEVLSYLKDKCGLDPKHISDATEGTIHIRLQGVPCNVACRFDDDRDECCEIHLEKDGGQELESCD